MENNQVVYKITDVRDYDDNIVPERIDRLVSILKLVQGERALLEYVDMGGKMCLTSIVINIISMTSDTLYFQTENSYYLLETV